MTKAYDITHCIYCGKKGFKNMDAVLEHVKEKHSGEKQQYAETDYVITSLLKHIGKRGKVHTLIMYIVQPAGSGSLEM